MQKDSVKFRPLRGGQVGRWQLDRRQQYHQVSFLFNRLRAILPKDDQRGSLGKSHENGDYLKTSRIIRIESAEKREAIYRKKPSRDWLEKDQ